jgi:hypothetical protein
MTLPDGIGVFRQASDGRQVASVDAGPFVQGYGRGRARTSANKPSRAVRSK